MHAAGGGRGKQEEGKLLNSLSRKTQHRVFSVLSSVLLVIFEEENKIQAGWLEPSSLVTDNFKGGVNVWIAERGEKLLAGCAPSVD